MALYDDPMSDNGQKSLDETSPQKLKTVVRWRSKKATVGSAAIQCNKTFKYQRSQASNN